MTFDEPCEKFITTKPHMATFQVDIHSAGSPLRKIQVYDTAWNRVTITGLGIRVTVGYGSRGSKLAFVKSE